MLDNYLKSISLVEKIYRRVLNDLKFDLNKRRIVDITNVQSFILYNISNQKISVGEIIQFECYMGSNVSYNLRKLVENGYVIQEPNQHDRRGSSVFLSEKGLKFYDTLTEIFENRANNLSKNGIEDKNLDKLNEMLVSFEKELSRNQYR